MKRLLIIGLSSAVIFGVFNLIFDALTSHYRSVWEYIVESLIFGLIYIGLTKLNDKGVHTWKDLFSLFKKKSPDKTE